jgi:hypothetical protein
VLLGRNTQHRHTHVYVIGSTALCHCSMPLLYATALCPCYACCHARCPPRFALVLLLSLPPPPYKQMHTNSSTATPTSTQTVLLLSFALPSSLLSSLSLPRQRLPSGAEPLLPFLPAACALWLTLSSNPPTPPQWLRRLPWSDCLLPTVPWWCPATIRAYTRECLCVCAYVSVCVSTCLCVCLRVSVCVCVYSGVLR